MTVYLLWSALARVSLGCPWLTCRMALAALTFLQ